MPLRQVSVLSLFIIQVGRGGRIMEFLNGVSQTTQASLVSKIKGVIVGFD